MVLYALRFQKDVLTLTDVLSLCCIFRKKATSCSQEEQDTKALWHKLRTGILIERFEILVPIFPRQ